MAYLTIARIAGEPAQLLAAYRRTADTMDGVGRDHGLIVHAAASTAEGFLILNLWPSPACSSAAAADPRRLAALREHALRPQQQQKEHHELERFVVFDRAPVA